MADTIAVSQRLLIICYDDPHQTHIENLLAKTKCTLANIEFHIVKTNDTWIRDYGPISIEVDQKLQLLDWGFDGWGGKFNAALDNIFTQKLFQTDAFPSCQFMSVKYILEGGSIDGNGNGLLLASKRCLVDHNRNPQVSPKEFELILKNQLGINNILWLAHGYIIGDDTDGHIDTLARFCNTQHIAYCHCNDTQDEQFEQLNQMQQQLKQYAKQWNLRLTELPLPQAIFNDMGKRLPASYANFVILNQSVLLPTFNDPVDLIAQTQLQSCFPDKKVITVPSRTLLEQGGSLHCATLQIPAI